MVAHKYSYGIPEARKTSIPAEAHVCPLLLPRAFGNSAAGQWKSDGATAGKNAGITIFPPERFFAPGVALCENINFPARIFNARFTDHFFPIVLSPPRKYNFAKREGNLV